jgi:hypothetical protein
VGAGDGEGIGGGRFSAFGGTFGSRQVACHTTTIWLWLERFRSTSILPNQSPEAEAFHFAPFHFNPGVVFLALRQHGSGLGPGHAH